VVVTGTGMIGCAPAELAMHSIDGECARDLTEAADLFNPQLVQMLSDLNAAIGGDVFIAANTNRLSFDFMFNPQDYGTYVRTCWATRVRSDSVGVAAGVNFTVAAAAAACRLQGS
jgi:hypothetical protein